MTNGQVAVLTGGVVAAGGIVGWVIWRACKKERTARRMPAGAPAAVGGAGEDIARFGGRAVANGASMGACCAPCRKGSC